MSIKELSFEQEEKQVNISVLENEDKRVLEAFESIKNDNDLDQNEEGWMTKEQCKIYLLNLAKDLYLSSCL